jgi:hypothetical protein
MQSGRNARHDLMRRVLPKCSDRNIRACSVRRHLADVSESRQWGHSIQPQVAGTLNVADVDHTPTDDSEDVAKLVLETDRVRPSAASRQWLLQGNQNLITPT